MGINARQDKGSYYLCFQNAAQVFSGISAGWDLTDFLAQICCYALNITILLKCWYQWEIKKCFTSVNAIICVKDESWGGIVIQGLDLIFTTFLKFSNDRTTTG